MHDQMTIPDYPLTQAQIDQYRRDGFIQLDDVIPADVLQTMRSAVEQAVAEETSDRVGIDARHRNERSGAIDDERTDQKQQPTANLAKASGIAERGCGIIQRRIGHWVCSLLPEP